MREYVLTYLVTRCSSERDHYMGGVLTTDGRGLPLEFSYTDPPVEPTRLQRVLFGAALDGYIRREVIGASLLRNLEQRPDLVLSADEALLERAHVVNCPVVWVQATTSKPIGERGATQPISATQHLLQLTDKSSPIRVECASDAEGLQSAVQTILLDVAETTDVLDPISRVTEALDLIARGAHEE